MEVFYKELGFKIIDLAVSNEAVRIGTKGKFHNTKENEVKFLFRSNGYHSALYELNSQLYYYYPTSSLVRNEKHDRLVFRLASMLSQTVNRPINRVDSFNNSLLHYDGIKANNFLCLRHVLSVKGGQSI